MAKKKSYGKSSQEYRDEVINYANQFEEKLINLRTKLQDIERQANEIRDFYEGTLQSDLVAKITGLFGIGSLVAALYLFAPNFTGNVVANLEVGRTNLLGMVLFLSGLLSIFICLKNSR